MSERRSRAHLAIDRADLLAAGLMDDPARTARVLRQWIALGGDTALLAGAIAARTQAGLGDPLQPRNQAVTDLAPTFVGNPTEIAEDISHELSRYGREDWRGDKNLLAAPAAYHSQPRLFAAYHATRANGGPFTLSPRQILRILKSSTVCYFEAIPGHADALLPKSGSSAHPANQNNKDRPVNALTPISDREFVDAMSRAPAGQPSSRRKPPASSSLGKNSLTSWRRSTPTR